MADLSVLKQKIQQLREAIELKLPDIATTISLSAKAIAERRIKEKGFGKLYSENLVDPWYLDGVELNARGKKFIEQKQEDDEKTNWKQLRQAQGLQVAFVDLSYTNMMWSNMAPVRIVNDGTGRVLAPLGATNREARDKMVWNFQRYGDWLGKSFTEDDIRILGEIPQAEFANILKQLQL